MISSKYHCIYIHIPKTAGTSVETSFGVHGERRKRGAQDHRSIRNLHDAVWPPVRGAESVEGWLRFFNQRIKGRMHGFEFVTKDQMDTYFKFAFVRNPWDRVYSWYRNVMRDELHQKELSISGDSSFPEFVQNHLDVWALKPQLSWITDEKGEIAIDYIGKFETLEDDYRFICEKVGKPAEELPKALHYGTASYREAYDSSTKALVAEKYAEEIQHLGYSF